MGHLGVQGIMITMDFRISMLLFQTTYPRTYFGWKKSIGSLEDFSKSDKKGKRLNGKRLVQNDYYSSAHGDL